MKLVDLFFAKIHYTPIKEVGKWKQRIYKILMKYLLGSLNDMFDCRFSAEGIRKIALIYRCFYMLHKFLY